MTDALISVPLIPTPPPGEDELPYDFGEPMESDRHRRQMSLSIESLTLAWDDRDDFFVGGNMAIYFSELQTKKNDFRGPDIFVVLDTVRREHKSWVVWQEGGRTPDVIIELLSESTEAIDRGEKMRIYARLLRVPNYYLFDPLTGLLEGYVLDGGRREYQRMAPLPDGDLPCPALGLRLGVVRGAYQGVETDWLRWKDESGRVLPTGEERARAEADKRAEAERLALAEADKRAEAERLALAEADKRAEAERLALAEADKRAEAERKLAEALAELERLRGSAPPER